MVINLIPFFRRNSSRRSWRNFKLPAASVHNCRTQSAISEGKLSGNRAKIRQHTRQHTRQQLRQHARPRSRIDWYELFPHDLICYSSTVWFPDTCYVLWSIHIGRMWLSHPATRMYLLCVCTRRSINVHVALWWFTNDTYIIQRMWRERHPICSCQGEKGSVGPTREMEMKA